METQAYLWHYIVSGILFAALGALGHLARAIYNVYPDRLSDRPMMDMFVSDGYDLSDRLFGTEYDDAGYYRLDSLKNLRNCAVATVLGGWAVMLLAPGASGMVAHGIDQSLAWLWDLFLYRLANPRLT